MVYILPVWCTYLCMCVRMSHLFLFVVSSFVEFVPYVFTKIPGVSSFLSARINQDPVEKFFGM